MASTQGCVYYIITHEHAHRGEAFGGGMGSRHLPLFFSYPLVRALVHPLYFPSPTFSEAAHVQYYKNMNYLYLYFYMNYLYLYFFKEASETMKTENEENDDKKMAKEEL